MIRLFEIMMFLAPIVLFVGWRVLMPDTEVSVLHITALAASLIVCLGMLVWLRQQDAEPASTVYVPAELHGREIVPPRAEP